MPAMGAGASGVAFGSRAEVGIEESACGGTVFERGIGVAEAAADRHEIVAVAVGAGGQAQLLVLGNRRGRLAKRVPPHVDGRALIGIAVAGGAHSPAVEDVGIGAVVVPRVRAGRIAAPYVHPAVSVPDTGAEHDIVVRRLRVVGIMAEGAVQFVALFVHGSAADIDGGSLPVVSSGGGTVGGAAEDWGVGKCPVAQLVVACLAAALDSGVVVEGDVLGIARLTAMKPGQGPDVLVRIGRAFDLAFPLVVVAVVARQGCTRHVCGIDRLIEIGSLIGQVSWPQYELVEGAVRKVTGRTGPSRRDARTREAGEIVGRALNPRHRRNGAEEDGNRQERDVDADRHRQDSPLLFHGCPRPPFPDTKLAKFIFDYYYVFPRTRLPALPLGRLPAAEYIHLQGGRNVLSEMSGPLPPAVGEYFAMMLSFPNKLMR
jgi:hypothetical protein